MTEHSNHFGANRCFVEEELLAQTLIDWAYTVMFEGSCGTAYHDQYKSQQAEFKCWLHAGVMTKHSNHFGANRHVVEEAFPPQTTMTDWA
jgi:hypothetical protein